MNYDFSSQFSKLLVKSSHILIMLAENPSYDILSAGLGLAHFLNKKEIEVTLCFTDPQENEKSLFFLEKPKQTKITPSISGSRDLVLVFNTEYNDILKTKTERTEKEFRIYITPEQGMIDPRDFSFTPAKFPYDLIVTLGMKEKESVGKIYEEVPDLFYEVPVINLDNQNQNSQFGQLNLVKITASSVSEIVIDLLKNIDEKSISENCANCLLTGIISATHSFQKQNTTPNSMNLASFLISKGANQQNIIHHLYKTQSLSLIKLWGKAMSNLNKDEKDDLIWTILTQEEIKKTESKTKDLFNVLAKIKQNYSKGKIYALIYEDEKNNFNAIIDAEKIGGLSEENFGQPIFNNIYKISLETKIKRNVSNFIQEKIKANNN